ncbi:MAG TPA: DciA family protein [Ornithinibacter sp.]|nr:DciA family protein [Ornithinibacter sp.]
MSDAENRSATAGSPPPPEPGPGSSDDPKNPHPPGEESSGEAGDSPGGSAALPVGDAAEAAAAALARARAAAKAKGLRPGLKPRRRTKDIPVSQRSTGGRDPKLLGDQLDQFVVERGWAGEVAVGAVIGRWPQIVGHEIAQHCAPVDFVDGVLTIRADSTAWATQLRLLSSSLLARLAEDVGEGTVAELRVVGPGAPSWSRGQRRANDGRGPRDTYG